MKTLIVYYSFTGNNALLAGYLKERLHADVYGIAEVKQRTGVTILLDVLFGRNARIKTPSFGGEYDRLVVLGPIWNAGIASPVRTFLKMERGRFEQYAFISVCGGRAGQEAKVTGQLTAAGGKAPVALSLLSLNDRLPADRKLATRKGTSYKIEPGDMEYFKEDIEMFLGKLGV
ncbi:MAG: flavodoxin family protein [Bacteroidetes bacterium]|nr:flavodoxin family protein [Bacteroidota bacterium]